MAMANTNVAEENVVIAAVVAAVVVIGDVSVPVAATDDTAIATFVVAVGA